MVKQKRRAKVEAATLRKLRKDAGLTQADAAAKGSLLQGDVSKLERRASFDVVSTGTLRRYVEALGGRLEVYAVIGKRRVLLKGAEAEDE